MRKEEGSTPFLISHSANICKLLFLSNRKNLASIVGTALLASSMRQASLTALGACYDAGDGELPMRATSLIPSCLGNFTLGNSHE
jgi:hypothetical protein